MAPRSAAEGRSRLTTALSHCGCRHKNANPLASLPGRFRGSPSNYTGITDTDFNELIERAWAATDFEEMLSLAREADMYFIREHWSMMLPIVPQTMLVQPWLKDYTGQEAAATRPGQRHDVDMDRSGAERQDGPLAPPAGHDS